MQRSNYHIGCSACCPSLPLDSIADVHVRMNDAQDGVLGGDGVCDDDVIDTLELNVKFAMGAIDEAGQLRRSTMQGSGSACRNASSWTDNNPCAEHLHERRREGRNSPVHSASIHHYLYLCWF